VNARSRARWTFSSCRSFFLSLSTCNSKPTTLNFLKYTEMRLTLATDILLQRHFPVPPRLAPVLDARRGRIGGWLHHGRRLGVEPPLVLLHHLKQRENKRKRNLSSDRVRLRPASVPNKRGELPNSSCYLRRRIRPSPFQTLGRTDQPNTAQKASKNRVRCTQPY
jgi:hypothetical protein